MLKIMHYLYIHSICGIIRLTCLQIMTAFTWKDSSIAITMYNVMFISIIYYITFNLGLFSGFTVCLVGLNSISSGVQLWD